MFSAYLRFIARNAPKTEAGVQVHIGVAMFISFVVFPTSLEYIVNMKKKELESKPRGIDHEYHELALASRIQVANLRRNKNNETKEGDVEVQVLDLTNPNQP